MKETPIKRDIVNKIISQSNITSFSTATIRMIKKLVDEVEQATGERYIRMEMGVPGLPPSSIGIEAEIEAHKKGLAAIYPDIQGIPPFKKEVSRFVKLFLNIDVDPEGCIPTVGSTMGSFATFMTVNNMWEGRDTTLFIDPGFPLHKQQHMVLGIKNETFDIYEYRGEKLRDKLESYLSKGYISCIMYCSPNNPAWICFSEKELSIIGEMANKYNVIVVEDLAYFAMDFRKNYGVPGQPPFQPSVAHYSDNYILLISSSKVFSYAGQRLGMMIISDKVFNIKSSHLLKHYIFDQFGPCMTFGTLYALSAGTAHTPQWALTAMLKAMNDGTYKPLEEVKEYAAKAAIMKKLFLNNGFRIVYDMDEDEPIADGFYFTLAYPGMTGEELLRELMYYGISAISLTSCRSQRAEGLRACVSLVQRNQFPALESRLKLFHEHHPVA
jgi:aspartate/methionine/tyrosine aminotransferase